MLKKKPTSWTWALSRIGAHPPTVTETPDGVLVECDDVPGAQLWMPRGVVKGDTGLERREPSVELRGRALDAFRRKYMRVELGVRLEPTRAPTADDVVEGLIDLGCRAVQICGRPRIFETPKGRRFMFSFEGAETVPLAALPGIARAAGLDLEKLEDAIGLTAARELEAARASAIKDEARRRAADAERRSTQHELEVARDRAKKAAEEARANELEAERLAARLEST